ncbi:hypothetical protein ASPZODRAFT_69526 [Penicilliopsis zonata CBS 506.65]|uniref:Major facilitator superfamily (MFS) profile domain-containing protein n=1 Tax=Penicilliopsis zonata CBS 506.65 TaxID=1073090 RepID=A0A1L9SDF6_9EURO|nr:hypothetical protein ASPZODRAFT_69526 [Penicilliopsis zonata CBS 506.65]OJJ45250.1 hypothetical protein ASPZODRAFT_69526 [Penicilliopsis zonata CBS 506.65]
MEKDPEEQRDSDGQTVSEEECQTVPEAPKFSPAPDGGATAWLVVLGAWCTSFCSFGWINSIGVFQSYYETNLLSTFSASTISWIPSLQVFFMFAMGPIIGKLYDNYGPHWLLGVGTLMHVFGLMMASISTKYYQLLLAQGVCSAIGVAAIFQPAINSVGTWFDKKRGAAYGILSTGSSIGGVLFPIMISRLIDELGFGWAMRIAAFMILALLIVANVTVRARLPPAPKKLSRQDLIEPFKEAEMLLTLLGFLLLTFGIFVPVNYLSISALQAGMSENLAQYLLSLLNAASLFGRLFSGFASDRIGRFNILVAVCYLAGIVVLAVWIPATSNAATIVFSLLFGFASGAYVSLGPALMLQLGPIREIGYRTGLLFLVSSFGGLTTSPIAGAILQAQNGSYTGMKIFSGVLFLAGATGVLAARVHHTGFTLLKRF